MMLKRKRSVSELCSSPVSSSTTANNNNSSSSITMDVPPPSLLDVPAHLHSRTFKRHRDSRPSDQEVHRKFYEWRAHHQQSQNSSCVPAERTLGLLYSAQQKQQQQQSSPSSLLQPQQQEPTPSGVAPNNQQQQQQQSLHRFWNINSAPGSSPSLERPPVAPSSCEDCGAGLAGGGAGADDMEVDDLGLEDTACGACGKHVCFSCSVSNLGEQKRCLQCAGRRVWIGGIGWTNASVSVC